MSNDLTPAAKAAMLLSEVLDRQFTVFTNQFNKQEIELELVGPPDLAVMAKWYRAVSLLSLASSVMGNEPCWDCVVAKVASACTHGYSVPPRELLV